MNLTTDSEDIVMKLLHYFITDKNYNPVVLYGAKNEIWLENLNSDYKIVRIVSNYIHNDEQLNYDLYKTKQIMKSIKKKTLSLKTPTLSLFVNLGDNVNLEKQVDYITCINVKNIDDVITNNDVLKIFPDINKTLNYKEEGMDLFLKLTTEINKKTEEDAKKSENIFKLKKPIVTYTFIVINIIVYLLSYIFNNPNTVIYLGGTNRTLILNYNEYYRLITSCFIHANFFHLFINCYSLYIIGTQVESFYGKLKYIIIYLSSGIIGNLLSICFSDYLSVGASGAIFGVIGALLYFGYHYRLYLGNAIRTQIIPTIILNLFIGFLISGIDNVAHIGGLIGGIFVSMACGVKYKSKKIEIINGVILTLIFTGFMMFLLGTI